jgi:hypothetical protein
MLATDTCLWEMHGWEGIDSGGAPLATPQVGTHLTGRVSHGHAPHGHASHRRVTGGTTRESRYQ